MQRIAEESPGYSKRQRLIARYISENSEKASFMTAQMLAEAAHVSESSVVRFARQLGFTGYSELRKALQQMIKSRLAARDEEPASGEARELKQTVISGESSLKSILTRNNCHSLEQAAELLVKAEKIVVQSGIGLEGIDAYFAANLRALGFNACACSSGLSREIFDMNRSSVLVIISGSYFSGLLGPAGYARSCGAALLIMADDEAAPLRQYGDVMLLGKGIISIAAIVEALLSALENSCGRKISTNLAELDALHREYDTYEHGKN